MDITEKYKKAKIKKNLSIVGISLILAIGFNIFIGKSGISQNLKSSVLNSGSSEEKADTYLSLDTQTINTIVTLKNSRLMNDVKSLNLTLIYNPDTVEIKDIYSDNTQVEIIKNSNSKGVYNIFINYKTPIDLSSETSLINILPSISSDGYESINIINSNFSDSQGNIYELSSSGIQI